VRQAAARMSSSNNLKQIGLAMHSYQDSIGYLPFNGTWGIWGSSTAKDSGSWAYQILPYIEQDNLYRAGTAEKSRPLKTYLCPGRGRKGYTTSGTYAGACTDYAINIRINANGGTDTGAANSFRTIQNIPDGSSNTIFAGQASLQTGQYNTDSSSNWNETWWVGGYGGSGRRDYVVQQDGPSITPGGNWGGPFPGGALFVLGDGSVRSIAYGFNLQNAILPSDGQVVNFD
jgi:hypothetical protein